MATQPPAPEASSGDLPNLVKLIRPSAADIATARQRLHLKAASILALLAVSYLVLVVAPVPPWLKAVSFVGVVMGLVLVGTGIMHDANHGAFSRSKVVNRLFGYTMDLVGGSSLMWRFKHNVLHHRNTNVVGVDKDINMTPLARFAPQQPWRPWHRYQHLYLWPLYGMMSVRWILGADIAGLVRFGRSMRSLNGAAHQAGVAAMAAGKAVHLTWAVVIPLLFHPWWVVLAFYLACSFCASMLLVVIFQMAHCIEEVEFTASDEGDGDGAGRRGRLFQLHQLRTTANIRCRVPAMRPLVRFVMSGLDHQIEHHLAPGLPHTIYPRIARRLEAECTARGLPYHSHPSVIAAIRSHARWLRTMGTPPLPAAS